MKKNMVSFIITGILMLTVCSCGSKETESFENITKDTTAELEFVQEMEASENMANDDTSEIESAEEMENAEKTEEQQAEGTFSFAELKNLQFTFCSGAGGWATMMTIDVDGSFSGEYFDGDLGATGEGYPNGTMYQCDFKGQFTQPVKINEFTYSMQISELDYAEEAGKEEIKNGVLYCYSEAYGLNDAEDILIYLPGAPLADLPEEFRSWVGYYDLSYTTDTELPFYALNNEAMQFGFSSYNIVDSLKGIIAFVEDEAAALENSISNDPLTQLEYNEKTKELYDRWDYALNAVWEVLKKTQDAETMDLLTSREREWIALKEQAVEDAGAGYEGGSIQAMIMNQKAAEMTKARVYELLELLDISFDQATVTHSAFPEIQAGEVYSFLDGKE